MEQYIDSQPVPLAKKRKIALANKIEDKENLPRMDEQKLKYALTNALVRTVGSNDESFKDYEKKLRSIVCLLYYDEGVTSELLTLSL